MRASATATVGLLAFGLLALGACGSGGDNLMPTGPQKTVLSPVSLAGISCG